MKKTNLHKIMEALDTQSPEELQAELHEWFVDQAKKVAQPVKEDLDSATKAQVKQIIQGLDNQNVYDAIAAAYEDAVGVRSQGYGYSSVDWESISFELEYEGPLREQVIDYLEHQIMEAVEADIDDDSLLNYLMAGHEITETGIDDNDDDGDEASLLGRPSDVEEDRVDELSTDTMMNYAKKARKDRDRPSADDEKVGRRVAGLDMVARKARREKAAPKYEAAPPVFDPEQNDDAKSSAWYVQHEESSNPIKPERYDMLLGEIKHGLKFGKDRDHVWDQNLGDGRAMDYAWRVIAPNTHEFPHDVIMDGSEKAGDHPNEYIGYDFIDIRGMNVALCYHEYPAEWLNESLDEGTVPADDAAAEKNADDGSENPGEVEESYNALVAELHEAFKGLETVSDKLQNVEGAQVGEQGKVPVNKKSTLPSKKGDKRVGGEPVEIKSNGHKGHALEKAPKVKDAPVKGTIQNDKDDPKKVADKGNKSALLNKVDGPINTQSPISGKGAKGLKK